MKEVKEGLNILVMILTDELLNEIHNQLHKKLNHAISFITLSERGSFYKDGKSTGSFLSFQEHSR